MPAYKYVGNRILTGLQNTLTGQHLSEWHSGYRAYRTDSLSDLDLASYSDGFDFDTEIILGLVRAGKRIVEVPIPTYYGDEICYVNGMKYAKDVTADVVRHWASQPRLRRWRRRRRRPTSTPSRPAGRTACCWSGSRAASRPGCSTRAASTAASPTSPAAWATTSPDSTGRSTTGSPSGSTRSSRPTSTSRCRPPSGAEYDVVVAGDILEHVMEPQQLLDDLVSKLVPGGEILVSVPNFGHWYPRGRIAIGKFDYDQRGPLDRGHVRFFTRTTIERLVRRLAGCAWSSTGRWAPRSSQCVDGPGRPRHVSSSCAACRAPTGPW